MKKYILSFANGYIKRIENLKHLTDTEKESLYIMISTSVNSFYLWNKYAAYENI